MEGKQVLTKSDWAKYPFTPDAAEYVKTLDIKIEDLASPEYTYILSRAENRIEQALSDLSAFIRRPLENYEIEISSFPIAVMMIAATNDTFIKRSYALAEAKRICELLKIEDKEKIIKISGVFNWKIRPVKVDIGPYDFALHFTDYLRNAINFHESEWKLVNRAVLRGEVYLTKHEVARLLEEEVRKHIEKKLDVKGGLILPENIANRADRLKQVFREKRGKIPLEKLPKRVVITAFPPCIRGLYDAIASGRSISHVGRFALTSFLINTDMTIENVIDLFRSLSDFDERMTRYQVEHIGGGRGSRTRYIPPRCDTLRTHGICPGMNEICRRIRHPLAYYRRKLRIIRTEAPLERA